MDFSHSFVWRAGSAAWSAEEGHVSQDGTSRSALPSLLCISVALLGLVTLWPIRNPPDYKYIVLED